jgi:hypothetical protein
MPHPVDDTTCTRSASCGVYLTVRDVFQFLSDTYLVLDCLADASPSIPLTRSGSRYQGSRSLTRPAGVAQRRARGWGALSRVLVNSAGVS